MGLARVEGANGLLAFCRQTDDGLVNGSVRQAEIHWYEGHGVGKKIEAAGFSIAQLRPERYVR
jgi:hypothetical protein